MGEGGVVGVAARRRQGKLLGLPPAWLGLACHACKAAPAGALAGTAPPSLSLSPSLVSHRYQQACGALRQQVARVARQHALKNGFRHGCRSIE